MRHPLFQPHYKGCANRAERLWILYRNGRIRDKSFSIRGASQTLLKLWYKNLRGGTRHEAMDHVGDDCGDSRGRSGARDPVGEGVFGRQGAALSTTQDGA